MSADWDSRRISAMEWVKATSCEATACVEVAMDGPDVAVRNSNVPGEVIWFTRHEWMTFIDGVLRGDFVAVDPADPV